ncbi:MAG: hypothetical protein AVDCRST_MAG51-26, partial [uncultured Ramlibacter sp.]
MALPDAVLGAFAPGGVLERA